MEFNQVSTVLNDLNEQVTGRKQLAPTNTNEFVSVANSVLRAGYDPVLNAITQMVTRTIFSIRPYSRRFAGLQVDNQRWGAITRKINIADKPFEDDARFDLVDGQAIDHYIVNKPNILQTNYYGANIFEKSLTIFKDSLDSAFTGPDQFGEFISMVTQNASDMIEQAHETTARATIGNFIAGKITADNGVIHLLTEYNDKTGLNLSAQDVYKPDNFPSFIKWVYGRIEELSQRMTERSELFQINVTDKPVMRHTPQRDQRVYLYGPAMAEITARVLADTYHNNFLKLAETESVNYWQSILTPDSISIAPTYLDADGTLIDGENVEQANIFGVIFDRDAMGYTIMNQWSGTTPLNVKGGYWNTFFHFTERYWNDFTEKGIVLLLD